jgi:flagellar biosynthetic protein FliR
MTILLTAGLVLARVLGLVMSMPVLNSRSIPNLVKAMLTILLTALLTPVVPPTEASFGLGLLLISMTAELMLGILMGGALSLVFSSMAIMSGIVSSQIGQAASMQFNPTMGVTATPVGNMANSLALSVFLGSNSHLVVLEILAESFQVVPVDHVTNPINGVQLWLEMASGIFLIALKMAIPMILLVLLINSFIAILSKVAQTMNMFFSVGFIISIYMGLILFSFVLPNILAYNHEVMNEAILELPKIFDLVGGNGG